MSPRRAFIEVLFSYLAGVFMFTAIGSVAILFIAGVVTDVGTAGARLPFVGGVAIFVALLAGYYLGPVSLFLTVPVVIALFYPINGLSVTDRVSGSVVVQVPREARKKS